MPNYERDNWNRFKIHYNSLQQQVFRFLDNNQYQTNKNLYNHFNAITKLQKMLIRAYKARYILKYGKPNPNMKPKYIPKIKSRSENIKEIIDDYKYGQ